jgi:hypothetical protein
MQPLLPLKIHSPDFYGSRKDGIKQQGVAPSIVEKLLFFIVVLFFVKAMYLF